MSQKTPSISSQNDSRNGARLLSESEERTAILAKLGNDVIISPGIDIVKYSKSLTKSKEYHGIESSVNPSSSLIRPILRPEKPESNPRPSTISTRGVSARTAITQTLQNRLIQTHKQILVDSDFNNNNNNDIKGLASQRIETIKKDIAPKSISFTDMSFDDAMAYLRNNPQVGYLHVTPRFYVEKIYKLNMYDLVVLERPGFPAHDRDRDKNINTSDRHRRNLMQLSLNGLLMTDNDVLDGQSPSVSIFLPLDVFCHEKRVVEKLLTLTFFRYYKEAKMFTNWKLMTKKRKFLRLLNVIQSSTIFSEAAVLSLVLHLQGGMVALEAGVDLFCYKPPGAVNVEDFLRCQMEKINQVAALVKLAAVEMVQQIESTYDSLVSYDHLQSRIENIVKHHPFSRQKQSDVDWSEVRGVQRIQQEYLDKIRKVFLIGQFMFDSVLSRLLSVFWTRFSQSIRGVAVVRVDQKDGLGRWNHLALNVSSKPVLSRLEESGEFFDFDQSESLVPFSPREHAHPSLAPPVNPALFQRQSSNMASVLNDTVGNILQLRRMASVEESTVPQPRMSAMATSDVHANENVTAQTITGQWRSAFVSKEWQREGFFLGVNIILVSCNDVHPAAIDDTLIVSNLTLLRVSTSPNQNNLIQALHDMYGALGFFLESMPSFKWHHLKNNDMHLQVRPKDPVVTDDGTGDLEISSSSSAKYFQQIKSSSIFATKELLNSSIKCMHQARDAFTQSATMESTMHYLQDVFRKVWAVSPEMLSKQLDRSTAMAQMREVIDNNITRPDDILVAVSRDNAKIQILERIVDQLQKTRTLHLYYQDIKNELGLVTSFDTLLSQIDSARRYKLRHLSAKLPVAFTTRCRVFLDYISQLKAYYKNESRTLSSLTFLVLKLKNFDVAKDLFDLESHICDRLYSMIRQGEEQLESDCESLSSNGKGHSLLDALTHNKIPRRDTAKYVALQNFYKEFTKERDGLLDCIAGSRMLILKSLGQMRYEALVEIKSIHLEIVDAFQSVAEADFSAYEEISIYEESIGNSSLVERGADDDEGEIEQDQQGEPDNVEPSVVEQLNSKSLSAELSVAVAQKTLKEAGRIVQELRDRTGASIRHQALLHGAHIVVGAANCHFEASEMDNFVDMERLETYYNYKYKMCNSMVDVGMTLRNLLRSTLGTCDVTFFYRKYKELFETITYLSSKAMNDNLTVKLDEQLRIMVPPLELVTFLKCPSMKIHHWECLHDVFEDCGMKVIFMNKDIESAVVHATTHRNVSIGTMRSIQIGLLMEKGLHSHLETLSRVTAESYIEHILETMLDTIEETVKSFKVRLSLDWLEDKSIKNKIFFDLNRVTNCCQLIVSLQYCLRAVSVAEQTSIDMHLRIFEHRTEYLRSLVEHMIYFVKNLESIQFQWIASFHFIKFSPKGELERDTERLYQSCTEEMKKIEITLQTAHPNTLFSSLLKIKEMKSLMESTNSSLANISQDVHNCVQSMLQSCPRLIMLPYQRTKQFLKAWSSQPHEHLEVINGCIHEMFEGVGTIRVYYDQVKRLHFCTGCISHDRIEVLVFENEIPMNIGVDDFIKLFDTEVRCCLARACDLIAILRVKSLRSLLIQDLHVTDSFFLRELFDNRMTLIGTLAKGDEGLKPNQSIALSNISMFDEDVWFCLGFPLGSCEVARSDIVDTKPELSRNWRNNLKNLEHTCRANVISLQETLLNINNSELVKSANGALFQLEIMFVETTQQLMDCPCLESAIEFWLERYQLRYIQEKSARYNNSPFEVTMGFLSIPYGMEYQGGYAKVFTGSRVEHALSNMISSASSNKGTIFVSADNENHFLESIGEYAVSCRDIACALGRICAVVTSVANDCSLKILFSKLVYLDAIGCVDFTTLDIDSMHITLNSLNEMWTALLKNDEFYFIGNLKYPLKTSFALNSLHTARKNVNLQDLRANMKAKNAALSAGVFIVGLASETLYSDPRVLEYLSKSTFSVICVEHNRPIDDLGMSLTREGFKYGMLMQMIIQEAIKTIFEKYKYHSSIRLLTSSRMMRSFAHRASGVLVSGRINMASKKKSFSDKNILNLEIACMYSVFVEQVILMGQYTTEDVSFIQNETRKIVQDHLDALLAPSDRFALENSYAQMTKLSINPHIRESICKSMRALGYVQGHMFVEQCASLWGMIANRTHPVTILSGPIGCGKSSVWKTVMHAIGREGRIPTQEVFSNFLALKSWRAAVILSRCVRNWLRVRSQRLKDIDPRRESATLQLASLKKRCEVHTTVIFYTAMSLSHFMGEFDADAKWKDGLLPRKLRAIDNFEQKQADVYSFVHMIVLSGPFGSQIEQTLGAVQNISSRTHIPASEGSNSRLIFPSGESFDPGSSVSIVVESSDLSHASPQVLMYIPHVHCGVSPVHAARRILIVWMRSIRAWMIQYFVWTDIFQELNELLMNTTYIRSMLGCDMSTGDLNPMNACYRISTFLRYLEELLYKCHDLVLKEATAADRGLDNSYSVGTIGVDSSILDGSVSEYEELCTLVEERKPVLVLSQKGKENLMLRMKLCVVYASVWGFGGGVNGSDRRPFFDSLARGIIEQHFHEAIELSVDCNLFEIILNLEDCCFMNALTLERSVPKRLDDHVGAIHSKAREAIYHHYPFHAENDSTMLVDVVTEGGLPSLRFNTPSIRAVEFAFDLLLRSGANILVTGSSGAGKSDVVKKLLNKLGDNCPNPQTMRADILHKLVDILGDGSIPSGIPAVLDLFKSVLKDLPKMDLLHDAKTSTREVWNSLHKKVFDFAKTRNPRQHCDRKTLFTSAISIRGVQNAESLRTYLASELKTDDPEVLEPPRDTYGVLFFDDVNVVTETNTQIESRCIDNRIEGILKGLLDGALPFGIDVDMRLESTLRFQNEPFPFRCNNVSCMHKAFTTDPRLAYSHTEEDYSFNPMTIIAAATGDLKVLEKGHAFAQLLPSFCAISVPSLSTNEIKTAMVYGCVHAISSGVIDHAQFVPEIRELTYKTIEVLESISKVELGLTAQESIYISLITPSMQLINNFCVPFMMGSRFIDSPSALLQLWWHEWSRQYLDPLPPGGFRSKLSWSLLHKINNLDNYLWKFSGGWMQALTDGSNVSDAIWTDTGVFKPSEQFIVGSNDTLKSTYAPLCSAEVGAVDMAQREVDASEISGDCSVRSVLVQCAMQYVLRIIRIFSSMKCHLVVNEKVGSSAHLGLQVSSLLLSYHFCSYDVKYNPSICLHSPSIEAVTSLDFRKFMKNCVLEACGFLREKAELMYSAERITYTLRPPQKILMCITSSQNLRDKDRILLLHLIECEDPCMLFSQEELSGTTTLTAL